jgi:hypothetical protein
VLWNFRFRGTAHNGLTCCRLDPVANDPGRVKTHASRECAELFSPFSSFGDDWQSSSFPIHRNRERISTSKFEVGVFTQPGPLAAVDFVALCRVFDVRRTGADARHSLSWRPTLFDLSPSPRDAKGSDLGRYLYARLHLQGRLCTRTRCAATLDGSLVADHLALD